MAESKEIEDLETLARNALLGLRDGSIYRLCKRVGIKPNNPCYRRDVMERLDALEEENAELTKVVLGLEHDGRGLWTAEDDLILENFQAILRERQTRSQEGADEPTA